jgi:NAD(P)-dependent dehydrogenase (short-subunit alcohol dehydrogenase family)
MKDPKVALITGANSGIGRWTALKLAKQGHRVFLACRSEEKAQPVVDEINALYPGRAEFLPLDLADLDSVRKCAERFLALKLPLNLLVCNAGLAGSHGRTKQGFELTFGVCHVGHFLLTQLLLERIKASAPARIVVVASRGHLRVSHIDFNAVRERTATRTGFAEYCVAKLANVLFAAELGRRLQGSGVTTYSLHPGVVATEVWRTVPAPLRAIAKLFMKSEEDGAATSLYCATDPAAAKESGLYYVNEKVTPTSKAAQDGVLAQKLWSESERWVAAA